MVGAAIGVAGTLLPALVKRELPAGADLMTGVYTMALCPGGALGAGLSIPLADWLGAWHLGLAGWSVLALIALLAWLALAPRRDETALPGGGGSMPRCWAQPLALAGHAADGAAVVAGLYRLRLAAHPAGGHAATREAEAGWMMGASVMVQLPAALAAPWLARLGRDQRPALLCVLTFSATGFWLLLQAAPSLRWLGVILLGLGQGGSFSLALTLIVLRTGNSRLAGKLSGLAQGGGYSLAAMGPLGVGVMLQFDLGLAAITSVLLAICALSAGFALFAGRNRRLEIDDSGQVVTR